MDEATLRQQISSAARQLWMRGLIVADGGMIAAEAHRRRYLATPPGRRRSELSTEDLLMYDLSGTGLNGDGGINANLWRVHRLAFQLGMERTAGRLDNSHPHPGAVGATITATPPMTLALLRLLPEAKELHLTGLPPIPIVAELEDAPLRAALEHSTALMLGDRGLFCAAATLGDAVNLLERIEHAAGIEIVCLRHR